MVAAEPHVAHLRPLVSGDLATSVSADVVQAEVGMWLHAFNRRNENAIGLAIADRYVSGEESSISIEALLGFRLGTLHPFEASFFGGIEREIRPQAGTCLTGVTQLATSHRIAPVVMPSVIYCPPAWMNGTERWRIDAPLGVSLGVAENIRLLVMYQLTYLEASRTGSDTVSHLTHGPRGVFVLDIP